MTRDKNTSQDDKFIAELLQLAGPRADPPVERAERVRASVRAHWQQSTARGRRPRRERLVWLSAAAAALVMAIGVVQPWRDAPDAGAGMARIVSQAGSVTVAQGGEAPARSDTLMPGDRLETGADGALIFIAASGHEVRVDSDTRLELLAADRLALTAGAVYVDSRDAATVASLGVVTPHGVARDIGTRFAVRVADDAVEVLVRDGEVRLSAEAGADDWPAGAGEGLRRLAGSAEVERFELPSWDERWSWTRELASFDVDGSPAIDYLEWLCREYGWTLRMADQEAVARAQEATRGDVPGLPALDSLRVVMRTHLLAFELDEARGELIVSSVD